jgi:hypothetical protein
VSNGKLVYGNRRFFQATGGEICTTSFIEERNIVTSNSTTLSSLLSYVDLQLELLSLSALHLFGVRTNFPTCAVVVVNSDSKTGTETEKKHLKIARVDFRMTTTEKNNLKYDLNLIISYFTDI